MRRSDQSKQGSIMLQARRLKNYDQQGGRDAAGENLEAEVRKELRQRERAHGFDLFKQAAKLAQIRSMGMMSG
jgi:ribosomal protein L34